MSVSKVSIRKKPITNGRDSLYLEFSPALLDMKTMRRVYKEHLHIYLYQKPKTNQHKEYSRRMMERAEGIRAIRVQQILNDEFSFLDKTTMKGDFMEYYRNLALEKKLTANGGDHSSTLRSLCTVSALSKK